MRIVLFHPTLLPPKDYGGVERVVLWLAKGLVESGHEVWVGAYPGSRLPKGARLLEFEPGRSSAHELPARLPAGVDVVHFMAPPEAGAVEKLPCASLLTVHGNGKPGEVFPANTVFLSADHAIRHGRNAFVHNGIDPEEYLFEPASKRSSLLFLSKTSWKVKNLRGAARLCGKAGTPLVIAGGNRPWSVRARAMLTPGWSWAGPVAGRRKAELLTQARGLVFPILWPEPFGLVVAEALMSGTPVVASPQGSLPELVTPEVGALIDLAREDDWVLALRQALDGRWSPEACRRHALERFHYLKMTEAYVRVYKRVATGDTP